MAILNVRVRGLEVSVRQGEKNGRKWRIRSQNACFVELNDEIRRLPMNLQEEQPPYEIGEYTLDVTPMIEIGTYGLEFNRYTPVVLVPVLSSADTDSNKKSFIKKSA